MSRFRELPSKTMSFLTKRVSYSKDEIKFFPEPPENITDTQIPPCDEPEINKQSETRGNSYNTFLIDHNLLKPLSFECKKIHIFYFSLIIWIILIFGHSPKFRYFIAGVLFMLAFVSIFVFYFYFQSFPIIQYRQDLLNFYENELENLRKIPRFDDTKFMAASRKRKGWVYVVEKYQDNEFKNSDLVLAYAILQNKTLTLYVVDDKFILKPRLTFDNFNLSLKKMKSCLKIALDLSEFSVEILPKDLTMGRIWNKKYPIKFSTERDVICQMIIDASAATFVDFTFSNAEPFVIPSYHRQTPLKLNDNFLYLFGVCAREKERWYYKIIENCELSYSDFPQLNKHVGNSSRSSFNTYILDIFKKGRWVKEKLIFCPKRAVEGAINSELQKSSMLMASSMFSLNVIFTRLFWDFWREEIWRSRTLAKIQRSLDRIELIPLIKSLKAEDLNMGDSLPLLFSAEEPEMDDDGGFWVNFPMCYEGNLSMTINIQMNSDIYERYIEKNTMNPETEKEVNKVKFSSLKTQNSFPYDQQSVDIDSFEIEGEIYENDISDVDEKEDGDSDVKILEPIESKSSRFRTSFSRMFNEIVDTSKNKAVGYVKKICQSAVLKFENSSLVVNLTLLKGTLSVYFPPPPTNRVWLGFRGVPVMILDIKSKIGNHREGKYPFLTEFLEKKLREEFKHAFVVPSTVDLYLPFLSSGIHVPPSSI